MTAPTTSSRSGPPPTTRPAPRFNGKLFRYIPSKEVRLLDIGCSGGGLVKSILDAGGFRRRGRGERLLRSATSGREWATIPDHLFTTDATVPFQLFEESSGVKTPLKFNVITAWEFLEHIAEEKPRRDRRQRPQAPRTPGDLPRVDRPLRAGHRERRPGSTRPSSRSPGGSRPSPGLGLQQRQDVEDYFHYDWVRGAPDDIFVPPSPSPRKGEEPRDVDRLRSLKLRNTPYEMLRSVYRLLAEADALRVGRNSSGGIGGSGRRMELPSSGRIDHPPESHHNSTRRSIRSPTMRQRDSRRFSLQMESLEGRNAPVRRSGPRASTTPPRCVANTPATTSRSPRSTPPSPPRPPPTPSHTGLDERPEPRHESCGESPGHCPGDGPGHQAGRRRRRCQP